MPSENEHLDGDPILRRILRRLQPRSLFGKYAITMVALVVFVLAVNGAVEAWIIYRESIAKVTEAQRQAANQMIEQVNRLFSGLERLTWVTRASAVTLQDRKADYLLLLKSEPAVSDVMFVDADGHQQLDVTRNHVAINTNQDLSQDPTVIRALSQPQSIATSIGPDHEPWLVLTMAHSGVRAGVTIARINLSELSKFFDEVPFEDASYGYVIDDTSSIVAASKTSPITVGTDLGSDTAIEPLLRDLRATSKFVAAIEGHSVIRSAAPIETTRWTVVIETPTREALRPLTAFLVRLAWLMVLGLGLAILAGLMLARRMIGPIEALRAGAASLANNQFDHRISVKTGDELEELAEQFNRMAGDLANSYGRLEVKVQERTQDLRLSVRKLESLEETGRALSSSLDLSAVLATVVSRAVALSQADAGAIYTMPAGGDMFALAEADGFPADLRTAQSGAGCILDTVRWNESPVVIDDVAKDPRRLPAHAPTLAAGFRSALIVCLDGSLGTRAALIVYRRHPGGPSSWAPDVMQTFAHQAVLALHNAHLYQELISKGHQLELANAHRTQFFANMSHELRTPLNAVLGYSELLYDGLYGTLPDRALGVLDRIQANGKHLLGLINDVLDITKMEAGGLSITVSDYSVQTLVEGVFAATEALAKTKGLTFDTNVPSDLPAGRGDDRRLTQVLLNLVGNAIKFTDTGGVRIDASRVDETFHISVSDTGPGISTDQQKQIFEEFHQIDNEITRKKGGTGLGLAISRRLMELHGGHIDVVSALGEGATFTIVIPIRAVDQKRAA